MKTVIKWHKHGKIASITNYKNDVEHGICRIWYENGHLKMHMTFADGCATGRWKEWDEHGHRLYSEHLVDGDRHGRYREWKDDELALECIYVDKKRHGPATKYKNGKAFKLGYVNDESVYKVEM